MTKNEIVQKIKEVFIETFPDLKGKDFSMDKKQEKFENWDSFAHMELVGKIEQVFEINLDFEEIAEIDSPGKFVEAIQKKMS